MPTSSPRLKFTPHPAINVVRRRTPSNAINETTQPWRVSFLAFWQVLLCNKYTTVLATVSLNNQHFTDSYFKQLNELYISATVDTASQRYKVCYSV